MLSKLKLLRSRMGDDLQLKTLSWTGDGSPCGCPLKSLASVDLSCGCQGAFVKYGKKV